MIQGVDVRLFNRRIERAFSLIEMVIVVVIIGIIAAIASPRLSRGVEGAAEAALIGDLAVVRGAIDHYVTEHIGDPPTGGNFVAQMIQYSDINGNTSPTKTGLFIYGPYLRAIPVNPYFGPDTVTQATQAEAVARVIVAVAGGWAYYDGAAGGDPVFYANSDTAGVGENDF